MCSRELKRSKQWLRETLFELLSWFLFAEGWRLPCLGRSPEEVRGRHVTKGEKKERKKESNQSTLFKRGSPENRTANELVNRGKRFPSTAPLFFLNFSSSLSFAQHTFLQIYTTFENVHDSFTPSSQRCHSVSFYRLPSFFSFD